MTKKPVFMEQWASDASGQWVTLDGHAVAHFSKSTPPGTDIDVDSPDSKSDYTRESIDGGAARVRLAGAAPALVRALLLVEWHDDEYCSCVACVNHDAYDSKPGMVVDGHVVHKSGCPVDDALKAAGFPDRASRDAAREMIRKWKV